MLNDYIPVLLLMVIAVLFAGTFLAISRIFGPYRPNRQKGSTYECGVPPTGQPRQRFSIKFFLIAVLFIIFDIEAVFIYPWAVLYKKFIFGGYGLYVFIEMMVFIGILAVGLIYVWKRGALEWE